MHIAPYFAAFGFLTIFHAVRIIRVRRREKIGLGHGESAELERLVRVFGNHSEYVPMGMMFLFALEYMDAPIWFLHLIGTTLLTGRILHAIALAKSRGGSPGRVAGMVLTLTSLALASFGVVVFSLIRR